MNKIYNLIGSNSFIATYLYEYLKKKNYKINKFTHSNKHMETDFNNMSSLNNIDIYFSIVRDDLKDSIDHLSKYIDISNKKNSKFFYISSINAKFPNASYYSKIKYECEQIVLKKGGKIIRLGLVISDQPYGPYKSLKKFANLPISLKFSNSTKITTTNILDFNNIDFENINENMIEIFDKEYSLNTFLSMNRVKKNKLNINLSLIVKLLKFINKVFFLKGIFERVLTLTCNED